MAKIFFSYSHKDEELRNELEKHLALMKRQGLIETWYDRRIDAGENIHGKINENLEDADMVLLLVSADFLNSDYCFDVELKRAMEKHQQGTARVIPIILRPCDWHGSPFGGLRATPTDGKPVTAFPNQDEALAIVARDIREAVETISVSNRGKDLVTRVDDSDSPMDVMVESRPRSSNMRVKRKFSDKERDDYLDGALEYMARFFESSLAELEKRNIGLSTRFKRVDSLGFTAAIYQDGQLASSCTIWLDQSRHGIGGIAYFGGITSDRNQYNESLNVRDDGYSMHLRFQGLSFLGVAPETMSYEGASEYYWSMLIRDLQ